MLESIAIRDFTIIDRSEIEFNRGMTALTGETGAGKSILLDAIKLVLGDRADSGCVKSGSERADICVSFDVTDCAPAASWLQEHEFGADGECLLRRTINASGRSKAFINGVPATLQQLRQLGETLVDIHGQHEHQSLQKATVQRDLLDASLPDKSLLTTVSERYRQLRDLETRYREAIDDSSAKQQRVDLLQLYQGEFDALALQAGEAESLNNEYQRLAHAGQIMETCDSLINTLYEAEGVNIQQQLSHCAQQIEQLSALDDSLNETRELISSALIQVEEASSSLNTYRDAVDLDPARLDWLNERIGQIQGLARKHQVEAEALPDLASQISAELDQLTLGEQDIEKLGKQRDQALQAFVDAAAQLSAQRQTTATQLSQRISEEMQTLGMEGGQFRIEVTPQDERSSYTSRGFDRVEFLVSANPGQPLRPLGKVASGGELSRISLAIQVILAESSSIPTLIFDEVDAGIGGAIAEIVGRKLRSIATHRQVFCVTHLPQVASQANQHYQVSKNKTADSTQTEVRMLDQDERLEEVARMLGGMNITEQTRAHAREMIESA